MGLQWSGKLLLFLVSTGILGKLRNLLKIGRKYLRVMVCCALCPMSCVLCLVLCALCPMPSPQCLVPCALCSVSCVLSPVPCALCAVSCALCLMPSALCPVSCITLYNIYCIRANRTQFPADGNTVYGGKFRFVGANLSLVHDRNIISLKPDLKMAHKCRSTSFRY
jgi:hypothetical protein